MSAANEANAATYGHITIEVLYGEFANLFGDLLNVRYLEQCLPGVRVVHTALGEEPAFARGEAAFVYMAGMTESQQELAIDALRPYKAALEQQIDAGTVFLMTGNALELFEAYIENEDGSRIEGLGIFPTYARRQMMNRYNSLILGSFDTGAGEPVKVVGYKGQFSHSYGSNEGASMFRVLRGDGLNPGSKLEGLRRNNFFATYTLGPLLVNNPQLTRYFLALMGAPEAPLAHEAAALEAYRTRLAEFEKPETKFLQ